ncbi:DUF1330 domain-containing protein [Variovorax sp. LT1R16]|uniref:DUF1330 domain-containing protein n=1 Tax=Variovorax sp. LT1R16 TaxID=3443728 RepID=UPI003F45182B
MADGAVMVVVEVRSISDPEHFKAYQAGAREQITRWGGRVAARGSAPVAGEHSFAPLMIQEWPSAKAFLAWQESEEYRPLREIRRACADLRMAMVPMVDVAPLPPP